MIAERFFVEEGRAVQGRSFWEVFDKGSSR